MSMYNMIHGTNKLAPMVLAMLGIEPNQVPRLRDAYYDGENLCIYTRTGGGNREYYDEPNDDNKDGPWNSDLRASKFFISDEDDDYDSTYATFFFLVPPQFEWFKAWAADKTERPAAERWAEAIEYMRTAPANDPLVEKLTKAMQPVIDFLAKP